MPHVQLVDPATTASMSGSSVQQRLEQLDSSSSNFSHQVETILQDDSFRPCVSELGDGDVQWVVEWLDRIVDSFNPSDSVFHTCLSELKHLCGSRTILPTFDFSFQSLHICPDPFATGGYGDVHESTVNDSELRVKRVRVPHHKYLEAARKSFCEGVVTWKRLKHKNVASLLGATLAPLQLISDWMPNGDLPEYIGNHPEADLVQLLSGVAEGIVYIHSFGVIHREIKGSNVLVDAAGNPRIVDFGLALVTTREHFAVGPYQSEYSPRWTAPEVLSRKENSKAADIFSFGMLTVEVLTGTIPLDDLPGFKAGLAIIEGVRPSRPEHIPVTDQLWELIQKCWNPEPQARPDAEKVLSVLEKCSTSSAAPRGYFRRCVVM